MMTALALLGIVAAACVLSRLPEIVVSAFTAALVVVMLVAIVYLGVVP